MSSHVKRNYRPRTRVLGAVTGIALLVGGGFAAQAVADSGSPKVTTTGNSASQSDSKPSVSKAGDSKSAGTPKVVHPGTSGNAPKVVHAGTSGNAPKVIHGGTSGDAPKVVHPGTGGGHTPAGNAPKVINPGSGVHK
ncbi:hypothetical protein [Streptomyces sp. NBC_01766]|uniref:hypothetical protein n=1 Tax=Streptomyces sp. NBC_01766 TaxID=2975936 RepID=UPI002DD9C397|nr:hypothetical protein [Streptomyces sp. NBC_01766]WSC20273.1 hypothetical protein OIE60_11570 [Streptomyces sp. NBC_01766]